MAGPIKRWLGGLVLVVLGSVVGASPAGAQAVPDSVSVDVEGPKTKLVNQPTFSNPTSALTEERDEAQEDGRKMDWSLSLGGAANTGNTQSWNFNAGTEYHLSKGDHALTLTSLFNFGRANVDPADPDSAYSTVSKKLYVTARYDYFLTEKDALWSSLAERWDPLSGFDTQLLGNFGYLRAFIKKEKHYLAGRLGYSYTYENFRSPPADVTGDSHIQGLLAALDYENKLNEHVELLSSLTTIYNLNRIDVQDVGPFEDIRIYFTVALLSKIAKKLAFEARFLLLYDRVPAATYKTDTTTIFGLVYTLL